MLSDSMKNLFFKSLRSKQIAVFTVVATIFITVISLALYEANKKTVVLEVNGTQEEYKTHAKTVSGFLAEQDIEVAKQDKVTPSMKTSIENGIAISWEQAQQVAVTVNEEDQSHWTTKQTVGEVLEEVGIELTEHDVVSPAVSERLDNRNHITVDKAFEFTLVDGGQKKKYWSTKMTIGEFLEKEDIEIGKLDRIEGKKEDVVDASSMVKIVRVEKDIDIVEENQTFSVETRQDDSILKGQEKVVQEGKDGKISRKYEIVKEDGKEISRSLVKESTVETPTKKIIAVGTKTVVADATPSGSQASKTTVATGNSKSASKSTASPTVSRGNSEAPTGGKEFYVSATAYTAGCNGCSGITATGINLNANPNLKVIAVDPSVIPLGSKVWVEGYGHAIAGDTGGAIKGNKIDLHMPNKQAAYKFGKRQVKIKVIN